VTPRGKAALLWGVAGAMAFLAAHQAYLVAGGTFLGVGPIAAVAVVVLVVTAVVAHRLGHHAVPVAVDEEMGAEPEPEPEPDE
jgi:uncharacterized membrane protein YhhN